ncbi:hypothetical protein TraAM80_03236 [Trypanosoma rangeli]|uniref:Uncharacterized protein n=1 Tax=Trypanosoma rangeli TaxID=5698 RepID=A0A422NQH5_TRYRA|nr:uncharacterized protein TraAM80_03236 [Trypanosoma rangeli]RNF07639.1 hypothetical protein TraAM80_03236 [Trypanosoma rangeli]|eukprot:RNF07639.1 hypothetical protein TraAM80_03236 [Trypanosoma rangeli]
MQQLRDHIFFFFVAPVTGAFSLAALRDPCMAWSKLERSTAAALSSSTTPLVLPKACESVKETSFNCSSGSSGRVLIALLSRNRLVRRTDGTLPSRGSIRVPPLVAGGSIVRETSGNGNEGSVCISSGFSTSSVYNEAAFAVSLRSTDVSKCVGRCSQSGCDCCRLVARVTGPLVHGDGTVVLGGGKDGATLLVSSDASSGAVGAGDVCRLVCSALRRPRKGRLSPPTLPRTVPCDFDPSLLLLQLLVESRKTLFPSPSFKFVASCCG